MPNANSRFLHLGHFSEHAKSQAQGKRRAEVRCPFPCAGRRRLRGTRRDVRRNPASRSRVTPASYRQAPRRPMTRQGLPSLPPAPLIPVALPNPRPERVEYLNPDRAFVHIGIGRKRGERIGGGPCQRNSAWTRKCWNGSKHTTEGTAVGW